jgi:hypothetical protein
MLSRSKTEGQGDWEEGPEESEARKESSTARMTSSNREPRAESPTREDSQIPSPVQREDTQQPKERAEVGRRPRRTAAKLEKK